MSQKCKDCNGLGYQLPDVGTEAAKHISPEDCPTCEGKGGIYRTGPYLLASGDWSDGVIRRVRVKFFQFVFENPNRVRVYRDWYNAKLWHVSNLELSRPYDSFERAQEAALELARTGTL